MSKKFLSFKTIFPVVLVAVLMAMMWMTLPSGVKCQTSVEAFKGDMYEKRVEIRDGLLLVYDCMLPFEDTNTTITAEAVLNGSELTVTATHKEASSEILAMGNWGIVYVQLPKNREIADIERVHMIINGKNGEKEEYTQEMADIIED